MRENTVPQQLDCPPSNRTEHLPPRGACTSAGALAGVTPEVTRTNAVLTPKFPHRHHDTEATWRAARSWLTLAFPAGLDVARVELQARFPDLAQNIAFLEQAAEREASTFENTADADMSAFLAALGTWEKATLDGLAALDHARLEASPGRQLDLPQLRKLEAPHV